MMGKQSSDSGADFLQGPAAEPLCSFFELWKTLCVTVSAHRLDQPLISMAVMNKDAQ